MVKARQVLWEIILEKHVIKLALTSSCSSATLTNWIFYGNAIANKKVAMSNGKCGFYSWRPTLILSNKQSRPSILVLRIRFPCLQYFWRRGVVVSRFDGKTPSPSLYHDF